MWAGVVFEASEFEDGSVGGLCDDGGSGCALDGADVFGSVLGGGSDGVAFAAVSVGGVVCWGDGICVCHTEYV